MAAQETNTFTFSKICWYSLKYSILGNKPSSLTECVGNVSLSAFCYGHVKARHKQGRRQNGVMKAFSEGFSVKLDLSLLH